MQSFLYQKCMEKIKYLPLSRIINSYLPGYYTSSIARLYPLNKCCFVFTVVPCFSVKIQCTFFLGTC